MTTTTAPSTSDWTGYAAAYELLRAEIAAVPEGATARVILDVYLAANKVSGALPRLRALAPRFAELPHFDASAVERIDLYGHAAVHAHLLYLATQPAKEDIDALYKEVTEQRDILHTEVVAFCRRKLLDGGLLASLRGTVGFRNAAFDLLLLSTILLDNKRALAGRTMSTVAEVEAARDKAHRLNELLNIKENNDAAAPALRAKQQAYTLFIRAYDEARRGLTFIRWHEDDVDDILPTIYPRKRRTEDVDASVAAPATVPALPALPGGGPFGP